MYDLVEIFRVSNQRYSNTPSSTYNTIVFKRFSVWNSWLSWIKWVKFSSISLNTVKDNAVVNKNVNVMVAGHTLNGQPLLEFSHFDDLEEQGVSPELRVKVATLWVRVDFRPSVPREFRNGPDRNLTLWLFKVTKLHSNATHLSGKVCSIPSDALSTLSLLRP